MKHLQIDQIRQELNSKFIERKEDIEIILTSLVANTNCVFLGSPGTGKSALAQAVADLLTCSFFKVNLDENLDPDFVIGTISLKEMRDNDRILRNTQGKIGDHQLVFLDEVFKCNSAMKNALLLPLNERKVDIGDGNPKETEIRCVIGASNEYPNCTSLDDDTDHLVNDPNWDRWALRYQNSYIKSDSNFQSLLTNRSTIGRVDKSKAISLEVIDDLRKDCDTVNLENILPKIVDLRTELRKEGISLSDRRWLTLCHIISARTVMRGSDTAKDQDMMIIEHGLWRTPDEREIVKDKLMDQLSSEVGDATKVLNYIIKEVQDIQSRYTNLNPSAIADISMTKDKLSKFAVDAGSKNWTEIEAIEIKKQIEEQLNIVNNMILQCLRNNC
jgi:MoxR-like ATPase